MNTPSLVKIPDGGLKIPKKLVELTWNDPYKYHKAEEKVNFLFPSLQFGEKKTPLKTKAVCLTHKWIKSRISSISIEE